MKHPYFFIICGISIFFSIMSSLIFNTINIAFINHILEIIAKNLLNASYIAQVGLFSIGIYTLWNNKRNADNIKLSTLCFNLIKTYNYISNWIGLLRDRTFNEINHASIEELNKMYIKNVHFITYYNCEHERIEKSLGLLKIKSLKHNSFFRLNRHIERKDIEAIYSMCSYAKSLVILKESLRRYSIYNSKHKKAFFQISSATPKIDNIVVQKLWHEAIQHIEIYEETLYRVKEAISIINSYLPKDMQHIIDKDSI